MTRTIKNIKCLLALCLMFLGLMNSTIGWRPYRLEITNVTVFSVSDKMTINVTLIEDTRMSLYANVKENIQQPFAKIEFYVDTGDGLFDLKYINQTIDVCKFFRQKRYLQILQIIYKAYTEQGNFPTSCPIKKKLYSAKVHFDVETLPPTMPDKAMYLNLTFISKQGSEMELLVFYKIFFKFVNIKLK